MTVCLPHSRSSMNDGWIHGWYQQVILISFLSFFLFSFFFWLYLMACGLLLPQPGIKLRSLAVRVLSSNHWTTRKLPKSCLSLSINLTPTKYFTLNVLSGLPWWLRQVKNLPTLRETQFDPWVGKIPWRRELHPTPVFLPGECHGQRSLVGCSPRGRKELDTAKWLTHRWIVKQMAYPIRNRYLPTFLLDFSFQVWNVAEL